MSKKRVFISVSDIAAFVGQNKYDIVTPFERLWKKCDKDGYNAILQHSKNKLFEQSAHLAKYQEEIDLLNKKYESKLITKRQHTTLLNKISKEMDGVKLQAESFDKRINDISLTQQQKLEMIVDESIMKNLQSKDIDTDVKKEMFNTAIDSLNLTEAQKKEYGKAGESFINKTHGTLKEDDAIALFEQKYKVKLDTSQEFFKKRLNVRSDSFEWLICGKVDGLYRDPVNVENNYLVEVKNRTKSFFTTLRDYEKTQIQFYMWMLNIPQAKLVEKKDNKIRVTHVMFDPTYVSQIQSFLEIFLNIFETKFYSNDIIKNSYFLKDACEKKVFLHGLYVADIETYMLSKIQNDFENEDDDECMIDSSN
jgi:hypothetical protein